MRLTKEQTRKFFDKDKFEEIMHSPDDEAIQYGLSEIPVMCTDGILYFIIKPSDIQEDHEGTE